MFGRVAPSATTLCTFRAHSWIVRLVAAVMIVVIVLRIMASSGGASGAARVVIVILFGLSVVIPIALLAWNHRRGVHVREDGIQSISANGSRFLPWPEIVAFQIGPYVVGTIAVFAIRRDGTRVALSNTARWPYQRQAVEHIRDQLAGYREHWIAHAGPVPHVPLHEDEPMKSHTDS